MVSYDTKTAINKIRFPQDESPCGVSIQERNGPGPGGRCCQCLAGVLLSFFIPYFGHLASYDKNTAINQFVFSKVNPQGFIV